MIDRGDHVKFNTFCAANSGDGFISFFNSLTDEKKQQVYYIKGGPGCGKSTLLKQIAAKTDHAELIHCSGDPASLDGVVLPAQKAVIIDATAPHSHEPIYPGVGGNIVDLGICWEPQRLNKSAIILLSDSKKAVYKSCYALLKSAKHLHQGVFAPLINHLSSAKLQNAADKLLRQNALWEKSGHVPHVQKRFLSGISPDGRVTFNETICNLGKNVIILEDRWMLGHAFLQYLKQRLTENGIDHIACYHPLLGENTLQHLIVPSVDLSVVTKDGMFPLSIPEENVVRKIVLQGMLDKNYLNDHKNKLAFIKRLERELLDLATEKLQQAREIHMKIEQEYAKGIDFSKADDVKEKLNNNLFGQT